MYIMVKHLIKWEKKNLYINFVHLREQRLTERWMDCEPGYTCAAINLYFGLDLVIFKVVLKIKYSYWMRSSDCILFF